MVGLSVLRVGDNGLNMWHFFYAIYLVLGVVNFKNKIMNIKIDAVEGINLKDQLQIISDYMGKDKEPRLTNGVSGYKIESCGRRYHVSCKRTPTSWSFKIWWGV